ncbi:hypothetical protein D3C78_709390 [compost metagenome]
MREDAIDDQLLIVKAYGRQFVMGTRHFPQGRGLRTGDQYQPGFLCIRESCNGLGVLAALFFQSSQWPQTGSIPLALLQKLAPCTRQLQQTYGVPGGGRIENDMVIFCQQRLVGKQGSEFVKGGDLCGTGTGELLLDAAHHALGQLAAHRANDPLPIGLCSGLRVYLQC